MLVLQRDAQLLHALAAASLKALLLALLTRRREACRTSATAMRSCKRRIGVGSALFAALVPRRAVGAELACGTCSTGLMGGVLVLHIQARAALQGTVRGRRLTCRRSGGGRSSWIQRRSSCRSRACGVPYSCFVCVAYACGA